MYLLIITVISKGPKEKGSCLPMKVYLITKKTELFVRKFAPLGDPIQLTVRGYELSLRKADAELVEVEEIQGPKEEEA